jgi:integration host factor subunit beta
VQSNTIPSPEKVPAELAVSHPHLRVLDVELLVTTIFDQITNALAHGGRVELRDFRAFAVKQRNARVGHNPRTGELVSVKEKTLPFFRAGNTLRRRLNRGRPEAAEVNVMVVEASSLSRCRHRLKKAALRGGKTPEGGKVSLLAAK